MLTSNSFLNFAILGTGTLIALLLWSPRLNRNKGWRAAITPLASIIGSGFLVLGPILETSYGRYAPLVMAGLCLGAYLLGAAIRFNIAAIADGNKGGTPLVEQLEVAASWSLAFAYIISVAYYLNLFGAFGLSLSNIADPTASKLVTSAVFVVILFVGWTRGFAMLEHLEYISVSTKLAIIGGLLVGLAAYFTDKAFDGGLLWNPPNLSGWPALTLAFGLIVTVQGFETSRYLGAGYDSATRIRSMRLAQWVSAAIYMAYILLVAYSFEPGEVQLSETAIVAMMQLVAPILPALLVTAALAAQFSAAVADTAGAGGLISELAGQRINERMAYALLAGAGVLLTWSANVFEIISYASRAFAVYYALQAAIAAARALSVSRTDWRGYLFAALAILAALAAVFGQPVEVEG